MGTERKPGKNIAHETKLTADNCTVRVNAIKSLWRKACFSRKEVIRDDGSTKHTWISKDNHVSLKTFAHRLSSSTDETAVVARNWFHNKRVNTSNLPLGIGRTNRVGGGSNGGGKKAA